MKFNQAIKLLKEGEKVRRPSWEEDSYWELGVDEVIKWTDGTNAHIHLNQIDAIDWEIYEDDKGFEYKCTCLWSKDDKYGFIPNVNCPVHGKQTKKMLGKSVPIRK